MKKLVLVFALMFTVVISKAQTNAMDFTDNDCNGNMHNLFTTLDSGEVVILEFFMNCGSCIVAGQTITPMYNQLAAQYPGKVNFYAFAYNNTMTCTQANNVIVGNNINAIPFDSGATQVAYYGGFGMPTIAVVAGSQHDVLFSNVGFATGDTATMAAAIHNFFLVGINETNATVSSMEVFPNPASENVQLNYELTKNSDVTLNLVNTLGQSVRTIAMGEIAAGKQTATVPVADLKAGVYFIQLTTAEGVISRRVVIE
jgi:thiol-disulfide isomerase/thioredoxin